MKLKISLSLSLTKGDVAPEERYVDAIGTHHDSAPTDLSMGFTRGPLPDEEHHQ